MDSLKDIHRAFDVVAAFVDDVRIYHGCTKLLMTKKFLNGSDVVAIFQEMSCKRMAEGMAGYFFIDRCFLGSGFHFSLNKGVRDVISMQ